MKWIRKVALAGLFATSALPSIGPAAPANSSGSAAPTSGWVKYTGNPVLGGKLGTVFDVSVLREGERFRMWVSWRPKKSIALVESDDGIHWDEPRIALAPNPHTDWETDINRPAVLKRGDEYHLWYTAQARGHSWIGHASSANGLTWQRAGTRPVLSATRPWEKAAVMCPHVLWDEQTRLFRLWYSAGDQYEPDAIGYATSPDGSTWRKLPENPVFRAAPDSPWERYKVTACQVVYYGDWYYMFYIGFRDIEHAQIGLARSRDGLTRWERHPANPIIRPTEGAWDHDACYKPFALPHQGNWLLWYNGRHGGVEQIGFVTHAGMELGF